jgi:hypothetical protein
MKTIIVVIAVIVMLAGLSTTGVFGQRAKSTRPASPEQVVANLYRQHKKSSPFFQIKSRALLDKYFQKELADLLWQDAHSAGGEVGALDGDPLFNAQDMQITKFAIHDGAVLSGATNVPVSFENFGKKHQIIFRLIWNKTGWKIADIAYDDGATLLQILKQDRRS